MNQNNDSDASIDHNMTAEAFVPLKAELTNKGLEATQQLDLDIKKWVCSCGKKWDYDEKDGATEHLRSVQSPIEQSKKPETTAGSEGKSE